MSEWVLKVISVVIDNASPDLREVIKHWMLEIEKTAKGAPNPMDKVLVELLKIILNIQ